MKNSPMTRIGVARSILIATVAMAGALAAAGAAQALPTSLISNTVASVTGGCNGCGHYDLEGPTLVGPLSADSHDQNGFGSVGNAHVITDFGTQKVSADAFQAPGDTGPDVQTNAYSEYNENFVFVQPLYNLSFLVTGTLSAQPVFGPGSVAIITWDLEDLTHPHTLSNNTVVFDSGFTPLINLVSVPVGDAATLRVMFSASAYAGALTPPGLHLFADFSHTVHTYIDPVAGGPDVIGQSGHDYASPKATTGVPEPATWALMLAGFGLAGSALRRRTAAA